MMRLNLGVQNRQKWISISNFVICLILYFSSSIYSETNDSDFLNLVDSVSTFGIKNIEVNEKFLLNRSIWYLVEHCQREDFLTRRKLYDKFLKSETTLFGQLLENALMVDNTTENKEYILKQLMEKNIYQNLLYDIVIRFTLYDGCIHIPYHFKRPKFAWRSFLVDCLEYLSLTRKNDTLIKEALDRLDINSFLIAY